MRTTVVLKVKSSLLSHKALTVKQTWRFNAFSAIKYIDQFIHTKQIRTNSASIFLSDFQFYHATSYVLKKDIEHLKISNDEHFILL